LIYYQIQHGHGGSAWIRYPLALGVFAVAVGLRFLVLPIEAGLAFLIFYPGTAVVALLCGLAPCAMYIALSAITSAYIFLPPHWAFHPSEITPTLAFVISASTILLVIHFYQRRVTVQTRKLTDEIAARRQLANQLQHSLERIKQSEEAMHLLNASLEQRVAERTAALKRSNQELDEFAYIASHDLKEPLRGLHNYASFLKEDYEALLDEEGKHYIERMQRLVERMTDLINRLLAYSRLGSSALPMEKVAMEQLLADVTEDLQPFMAEKGVELIRVTALPTVHCNPIRVREVLQNLITNAAKYNDKLVKRVEIGCLEHAPLHSPPVFFVRDNGIGIATQHHNSVFRLFKRLHEQDKYGGGTGAGLSIVKKIIERHHGRIWLESTPGEGTTFYFTLNGNPS